MKTFYKYRTEFRPTGISTEEDVCEKLKNRDSSKIMKLSNFANIKIDPKIETLLGLRCPLTVMKYFILFFFKKNESKFLGTIQR